MASTATDILDGISSSLAVKAPVRVATTAAITLSGEQTIDDVAVVAGNRVLVKDQADPIENGIYTAKTGAWLRSADFNGPRDVVQGTIVPVAVGTVNGDYFFKVTTADPEIGVTDIEWIDVAVGDTLTIMRWTGTYSGATTYSRGDVAYYQGSSYIYDSDTAGTASAPPTEPWEYVAQKGAAGAGTGDMLGENNLSDLDDPAISRQNLGVEIGVDVQAYDAALDDLSTPGALGQIKVSDGAGGYADEDLAATTADYQSFTASGTWTKPTGASVNAVVIVKMWAAGGGGGGSSGGSSGAGGGGGGYRECVFKVSNLTGTVAVGIGAGGGGGSTGANDAGAGGNTTFGAYLTAYGGGRGRGGNSASPGGGGAGGDAFGAGGNGGASTGGTNTSGIGGGGAGNAGGSGFPGEISYIDHSGGGGGGGTTSNNGFSGGSGGASIFAGGGGGSGCATGGAGTPGAGGTSFHGGNGGAGGEQAVGTAGTAPGGGGGGGRDFAGGAGARGECRVWTIG